MSLPDALTLARLFSAPVLVWLLVSGDYVVAFWLFIGAGATDAIDGALARATGRQSALGAALDPIADKALLAAAFLTLGWLGQFPAWLVIAVVSRDALIVGAVMLAWMLGRPMPIRPRALSKVNTALQIVLAALILARLGLGFGMPLVETAGIALVGVLTLASAVLYLSDWVRHMNGLGGPARETP